MASKPLRALGRRKDPMNLVCCMPLVPLVDDGRTKIEIPQKDPQILFIAP